MSDVVLDGNNANVVDLSLPVAVVFAAIPFDAPPLPDPDRDAAAVFFEDF